MRRVLAWLVVASVMAGCGGSDGISVTDAWARPLPESAPAAAMFLTVENDGDADDLLVAARSDVCTATELHESSMEDGVMSMRPVTGGIAVPAGERVVLEPGGLHVMCVGPTAPFAAGTTVSLTLTFDGAGSIDVEVPVEDR